jgi:hypothetical protein
MAYGILNVDQIVPSVVGSSIGAGNASIMKNRIINGAMVISQYNGTSSVTPTATGYVIDRFTYYCGGVASKFAFQQLSATPPVGFATYLGATSQSAYSVSSTDRFGIYQAIEGFNTYDLQWGTANAKTVTLSAWVYSSLTGTFGGAIQNYAQNRSYPFTYSIPVANTWTQISITVAGDTSGTWVGASNAGSMIVSFGLGVGTTYSGTAGSWAGSTYYSATGAVSVVGTNGATFYITGVQLEVGSSATGFEYRQYGTELALCQRYYFRRNVVDASTDVVAIMQCYNSSGVYGKLFDLPVTMRATPTGSLSSITHFRGSTSAGNNTTAFSAGLIDYLSPTTVGTQGFGSVSGLVAGNATIITGNTSSAWIAVSAEL